MENYFVQYSNEVPICSSKLSSCTITMNRRNWISMFWNSYFAVVFLHFFFPLQNFALVSYGSPFALVWKANFSNKNIWLWKKKPGITWMDLIGFFKVPFRLTPYKFIHWLHSEHTHLGKVWQAIIYQLYTKLYV